MKRFLALTVIVFISLIAVSQWTTTKGDTDGSKTGTAANVAASANFKITQPLKAPISQVGLNEIANESGHLVVSINMTWLLLTGFLVLFMQVGFAFLVTGLTRAKNAGHMMMMNIASFAIALIAYYFVGFAFQFGGIGIGGVGNLGGLGVLTGVLGHGHAGLIGLHGFMLQTGGAYDVGVMAFFLFQVVFMETAGYIIIGAIAERINFRTFILAELAMGALIYPIFGMWMWGGGWLSQLGNSLNLGHGAVDFAGSGVVHATGGWAAMALAMLLGPRIGKYRKDGTPRAFPGHNLPFVVVGTLVLVFGWMGFNPGSTFGATDLRIGLVAVNTLLAACFGLVVAMGWTWSKWGKPDISMSCNGMLAGLVAITAPCAFVAPWAACLIGIIAGFLVCYSVEFFDRVLKIDDPCGAISVHGVCGAWGVIAVGLFADGTYGAGWNGVPGTVKGLFYGNAGQLGAQMFEVVVGFLWAWGVTWLIFAGLKKWKPLRVSPEVEIAGLDMGEFGALAYPDYVLNLSDVGAYDGNGDGADVMAEAGRPE